MPTASNLRTLAVDWSGARQGARSKIWVAEVAVDRLVRLENGRTREEMTQHLVEEAARTPELVVGLDFAFSLPAWFLRQRGHVDVEALWDEVSAIGESWLAECLAPFWGRPGTCKPTDLPDHFRATEREARARGFGAKSVFQTNGGGSVGTGSLRGMPHLARLRAEGFSIWPFHAPTLPVVIEIYPRALTGRVVKSSQMDRERYLAEGSPEIGGAMRRTAASSEDAFDAAVSAVMMARAKHEILALERADAAEERLEGRIWWPATRSAPIEASSATAGAAPDASCPFCDPSPAAVLAESPDVLVLRDRYPVSAGHTLVIPRQHVGSVFDLPAGVQAEVWRTVAQVRAQLEAEQAPDGFNIGVNDGRAAGQTVPHAHVHVIPRSMGDVTDPRGGVRWVMPERASYWTR